MKTNLLAIALLLSGSAMILPAAAYAKAPQCRDDSGKFIKCPPKPAETPKVKCKDTSGKFAKCSAPGAKPIPTAALAPTTPSPASAAKPN
jgi:hypothetical protein